MSDLDTFQKETRTWLEANCPPEMRRPPTGEDDTCWGGRKWKFKSEAQRQWMERMAAKGWTVPEWPREYGGGGLSRDEAKILRQEMAALGCRSPLDSFGIWMLGPGLLKYGNEEKKKGNCRKTRSAKTDVDRAIPSPARVPIWRRCRRAPNCRVITSSSMVRRFG